MTQYAEEFRACRSILLLTDMLYQHNQEKIVLDRTRYATLAVLALYAKGRRQMDALHVVASQGYGEDAMILARSLVNLCIDLGYITRSPDQTEARARRWIAKGRVERRRFAKQAGTTPPDEAIEIRDWSTETAFADEWPGTIEQRAEAAGLESLYNLPYRHGSSFDHSDSWSATSCLDWKTDAAGLMTGPRERFVDLALLTLACCAGEIASMFGKFYGFDQANAVSEVIAATVKTAFPMKGRYPGSTPSSERADPAAAPLRITSQQTTDAPRTQCVSRKSTTASSDPVDVMGAPSTSSGQITSPRGRSISTLTAPVSGQPSIDSSHGRYRSR